MQYIAAVETGTGASMKTPITVRIEVGLLTEARRCAREENRTLTNFIETVLHQVLSALAPASQIFIGAGWVTRSA